MAINVSKVSTRRVRMESRIISSPSLTIHIEVSILEGIYPQNLTHDLFSLSYDCVHRTGYGTFSVKQTLSINTFLLQYMGDLLYIE